MSEPSKPSTTANPAPITIDGVTVEPIRIRNNRKNRRSTTFLDHADGLCVIIDVSGDYLVPAIWLGISGSEMVLTRADVAALLPHLQRFVERGDLGGEDAGADSGHTRG